MDASIDIWKLLAGLGLFLFGMYQMEQGLKVLTSRTFKLFLRRYTKNKFKAIFTGTFVTAVLQSSSVVSLMTLAFVGAGIISMQNALGIILGSNLGTTFTGWIVASLGFKLNIEDFSLLFVAIGGVLFIIMNRWEKLRSFGLILLGFGFLFLGLDYMKTSVEYIAQNFDVTALADKPAIVFLLSGFIFTAIVQSSSAAMVVTLSALSSSLITFEAAAALVIGADLGTTITALLGGLPGGIPAKKQVAMGHFIFNLVTDVIAFSFLGLLIFFVKEVFGMKDDLLGLVLFHSTFNLVGIFIFLPFLNYFARFLEKRFHGTNHVESTYLNKVSFDVAEAAMEALNNETGRFIRKVMELHKQAFIGRNTAFWKSGNGFLEKYREVKRLYAEIFKFSLELQKQKLDEVESSRINELILVAHSTLHAAKSIKDIEPNLLEFADSTKSPLNLLVEELGQINNEFLEKLEAIYINNAENTGFEELSDLLVNIQNAYSAWIQKINSERLYRKELDEVELTTIFSVNREIYSAYKALLTASSHYLLDTSKSHEFDLLPGFRV